MIVMGIETSCDETAVAIVRDGREILSNVISSQIEIHRNFGGVVPEIASRKHLEDINDIAEYAVSQAGIKIDDIDSIAVTRGPGLIGALLVGVATAKAYCLTLNKRLISVHHTAGHIAANYLEHAELKPPFVCLVVSGGHTSLIKVSDYDDFEIMGQTRDDAAGEAFDKVARVLNLKYPGGPEIERLAESGDEKAVAFKRVMLDGDSFDFSFSGLKTAVLNYVNNERQKGKDINKADIAAGFQQAVIDVLASKSIAAVKSAEKEIGGRRLVIAGGVAANGSLILHMKRACEAEGIEFFYPSKKLCTDNAAMIAAAGYYRSLKRGFDDMDVDAAATWRIDG